MVEQLIQGLPVSEYFKYHPPQTEERKAKHEKANKSSLELFYGLSNAVTVEQVQALQLIFAQFSIDQLIENELCRTWAKASLDRAGESAIARDTEGILMHVQQVRMFINQGITVDELKSQTESIK